MGRRSSTGTRGRRAHGEAEATAPDRAALDRLEALYRARYEPSVRLAHLLVGSRHLAEELTQDAFVRLLPRISATDNPGGYLRVVLVNLCRDHGRRQTMAGRHPQEPQPDAPPPGIPETSSAVWLALQQLPERQRVAITLRFYADVPGDEIARILDVRPTTVRSLIHRGLAALKEVVPND